MAVAMGVAWRSGGSQLQLGSGGKGGGGNPPAAMDVMRTGSGKKVAWGTDTEKLMDIMVERFSQKKEVKENTGTTSTLDLLGAGDAVVATGLDSAVIEEFLEVDPDQPLPSDWEKCLDLKTGELYYVNKSTGTKTSEDPRKHQRAAEALMGGVIAPRTPARDFLATKKVETTTTTTTTLRRNSPSPGPRTPPPAMTPLLSFATGKRLWGLQLTDDATTTTTTPTPTVSVDKTATSWNSSPRAPRFPRANSPSPSVESNLELNLNLSPSRSRSASPSPPTTTTSHAVCTVEMVQHALNFTDSMVTEALKRTAKALGKRPARPSRSPSRLSKSPSSSSTSSDGHHSPSRWVNRDVAPVALMLARCSWCHSYVMVGDIKGDCPRCSVKKEGSLSVLYSSQLRVTRQRA